MKLKPTLTLYNVISLTQMDWASTSNRLGQLSYDTYVEQDFFDMAKQYNYEAGVGYNKANCTQYAHPQKKRWDIKLQHIYKKSKY